jgi:C_GCAxxG_C_C family probable redox protein
MLKQQVDPARVREIAEAYYRSGQFYCSEAIVKTINDEFGLGYPDNVVRLASGFPIGIGGAGCACGAVTGGVMALGMVFGRAVPADPSIDHCLALSRELHALFNRRHGCLCCRTLTQGMILKSPEHLRQCIAFTGEVAEETAKIILRETAASRGKTHQ